jgi:tetratricopeptide (TPR) repeat protein
LARLEEAKRLDPANLDVLLSLSRLQVRFARYGEALVNLEKLSSAPGARGETWALLALCHLRLGHVAEAQASAGEALNQAPGDALALEALADCLRLKGQWREALIRFETLENSGVLGADGRARIRMKRAHCHLNLAEPERAWELSQELSAAGYRGAALTELIRQSRKATKQRLRNRLGKPKLLHSLLLFFADKQFVAAAARGSLKRDASEGSV